MLKHHPPIPLIFLLVAFFSTLLAAAPADYYIAGVDQTPNAVRVFPRNKPWTSSNVYWSFTAGKSSRGWSNLSDVKLRKTVSHSWIALVCASGGNAGIIDVSKKNPKTDLDDVLWTGSPGDNPHAIERIPHIGAVVVASSTPGKLTLYYPGNPKKINDFKSLKRSSVNYDAPGAHGVLWDPNGAPDSPEKGILWVSLDKYIRKYKITGTGKAMRLVQEGDSIPFRGKGGMGHDLQPDYTNKNVLLATDSYGAYAYDISTAKWTTLREEKAIKSFVRHKSGEYLWVTREGKDGWLSRWVSFGTKPGEKASEKKGGDGMGFYKARVHDPAFE